MNVLILGATSTIARAIAREYASAGHRVFAAARDGDEAQRIASDLATRYGIEADSAAFDAQDFPSHEGLIESVWSGFGAVDIAVIAFGELGDQAASESDFAKARSVLEVNYVGAASLCEALARRMARRGEGAIVGVSSVAGDRGRPGNYFYGSAKGGFSLYLQGLRARMRRHGVHVLTAKLGFVDTPMTYGLKTRIPIASPESVARALAKAERKRKDTFYYPGFWRPVMFIVKAIPERLFKRLSL